MVPPLRYFSFFLIDSFVEELALSDRLAPFSFVALFSSSFSSDSFIPFRP